MRVKGYLKFFTSVEEYGNIRGKKPDLDRKKGRPDETAKLQMRVDRDLSFQLDI